MKRKTILTALALGLLTSFGAEAQQERQPGFKHALSVQPLYWLNNGFRLDYERQLKNPAHWLQISGVGYYADDVNDFWSFWSFGDHPLNEAWGGGLDASYKWFPFKRVLYTSAGLSVRHFNLKYNETIEDFISYERDGLTYYEPQSREVEVSQYFDRLGANLYLGVQNNSTKRFLIDAYIGLGWTYSFYDKDKYYPGKYYGYISSNSLSYRGITLLLGFRIGFRLGEKLW
ncbi:MAG: hypothetical protein LBQ65_10005 [Tannerellaceae bacterium]|jgi:hypothetical protein|nr:hypothetical protein [Tannerellaceae bacterium]